MKYDENSNHDSALISLLGEIKHLSLKPVGEHLTDDQFVAYSGGTMDEAMAAIVERHLDSCETCCAEMERLMEAMQEWEGEEGAQQLAILSEQILASVTTNLPQEHSSNPDAAIITNAETEPKLALIVEKEPELPPSTQAVIPQTNANVSIHALVLRGSLALAGIAAALLLLWIRWIRPLQQQKAQLAALVKTQQNTIAQQRSALDARIAQTGTGEQQMREKLSVALQQIDVLHRQNQTQSLALKGAHTQVINAQAENKTLKERYTEERRAYEQRAVIAADKNEAARIAQATTNGSLSLKVDLPTVDTVATRDRGAQEIGPNGVVVLSDHPVLHWYSLPGAAMYDVTVWNSHHEIVATTQVLQPARNAGSLEWSVRPPLKRGGRYQWQVDPMRSGNRPLDGAPYAGKQFSFRVLPADLLERYLDAELKLAVVYADAGMYDLAERALSDVADANAANLSRKSIIAQRLLEDIRRQRRNASK